MLLPSVVETIASIADRPLNYSSDAVKLRLEGDAFAFSSLTVVIGGEPAEWDYVTLESPNGERSLWEWVSGRDILSLQVAECGLYRLRYFIEGGFFSTGTPVECVDVTVRSPVQLFEVDAVVEADAPIRVSWQLSVPPQGHVLVFRQRMLRLAERPVATASGSVCFPAPRAPGMFSVTLQGTNSRDTLLREAPVQVCMADRPYSLLLRLSPTRGSNSELVGQGEECQGREHGETRGHEAVGNGDDDARAASGWAPAAVVAPGALVDVKWSGEQARQDDHILLCAGPSGDLSEVLAFAGCGARCGDQEGVREGRAAVRAPTGEGMVTVVFGVKYNHVWIPAAKAHLCVSDTMLEGSQPALPQAAVGRWTAMTMGLSSSDITLDADAHEPSFTQVICSLADSPGSGRFRSSLATGARCFDRMVSPANRGHATDEGGSGGGGVARVEPAGDAGERPRSGGGTDRDAMLALKTAAPDALDRAGRDGLCLVCLDCSTNTLIRPCNHVVLCSHCARRSSPRPFARALRSTAK